MSSHASAEEIKAAYRQLVASIIPMPVEMIRHAGAQCRLGSARRCGAASCVRPHSGSRTAAASQDLSQARRAHGQAVSADGALVEWLRQVYSPIDRLLGEVINPFPAQLKALSADPYDDALMEAFCAYLERSVQKLERVKTLFQSLPTPASARGFGLSVYHCFSEVEDALQELERHDEADSACG